MVIYGLVEILLTINAIAPGPVNTELFNVGKSEQQIEGMKKMNAFGRLGETDDITNVVHFWLVNKLNGLRVRQSG